MKKDFILTFTTQLIVLISGLLVFKFAKSHFGDIGFTEFSIIKRDLAFLYTLVLLGLGVALPKFIAKELGSTSGDEYNVLFAALGIIIFTLFFTGAVLFFFQDNISFLFFGNEVYGRFILPLYISVVGLSLHTMSYSYFRGIMKFNYSNLLQILNIAFVQPMVFFFSDNIEEVFFYSGLIVSIISLSTLIKTCRYQDLKLSKIRIFIPKLLKYGFMRLPADIGLSSLFILPVVLSAHTEDVAIAGYVAFSISLLSLGGQAVAPIGLIMLPKISHLLGERNFMLIQIYVKKLFVFAILVSITGTVTYQLFAEEILGLYLGSVENELIVVSKSMMWGMLFYPFYVIMRSIVDAYYIKAYNTLSIIASLTVFLLLYIVTKNVYESLLVALAALSIITFYFIRPLIVGVEA